MGNRYIRDSESSPTEHQVQQFPDENFCLRHSRIAQVILEVTRDSQVTGTCVGHVRVHYSPKTWDRDTAQTIICARLQYCLRDRDCKIDLRAVAAVMSGRMPPGSKLSDADKSALILELSQ